MHQIEAWLLGFLHPQEQHLGLLGYGGYRVVTGIIWGELIGYDDWKFDRKVDRQVYCCSKPHLEIQSLVWTYLRTSQPRRPRLLKAVRDNCQV